MCCRHRKIPGCAVFSSLYFGASYVSDAPTSHFDCKVTTHQTVMLKGLCIATTLKEDSVHPMGFGLL